MTAPGCLVLVSGNTAALVGALVAGFLAQNTGGHTAIFGMALGCYIAGAVLVAVFLLR